jgi:hypothetical protein
MRRLFIIVLSIFTIYTVNASETLTCNFGDSLGFVANPAGWTNNDTPEQQYEIHKDNVHCHTLFGAEFYSRYELVTDHGLDNIQSISFYYSTSEGGLFRVIFRDSLNNELARRNFACTDKCTLQKIDVTKVKTTDSIPISTFKGVKVAFRSVGLNSNFMDDISIVYNSSSDISTLNENCIKVNGANGCINFATNHKCEVQIFDMKGIKVYSMVINNDTSLPISSGNYIVKVSGQKAVKVLVK